MKMKIKLLKKLRKRFVLLERNNKYILIDDMGTPMEILSKWVDFKKALSLRREKILNEARRIHYLEYKNIYKD